MTTHDPNLFQIADRVVEGIAGAHCGVIANQVTTVMDAGDDWCETATGRVYDRLTGMGWPREQGTPYRRIMRPEFIGESVRPAQTVDKPVLVGGTTTKSRRK